ncbi:MAG: apolipoprotein A1/A4/E family protein [Deltaproteobacteria bacterium]|nr:apolipoprotein A1/A4/E family protein [Deltaproteobacteria bacterium]
MERKIRSWIYLLTACCWMLGVGCSGVLKEAAKDAASDIKDDLKAEMETQMDQAATDIKSGIDESMGELGGKVDELKDQLSTDLENALQGEAAKQGSLIADVQGEIKKLQDSLAGLTDQDLSAALSIDLDQKLKALEEALNQMLQNGVVDSLQGKIDELKSLLNGFDGGEVKDFIEQKLGSIQALYDEFQVSKLVTKAVGSLDKVSDHVKDQLKALGTPAAEALLEKLNYFSPLLKDLKDKDVAALLDDGLSQLSAKVKQTLDTATPAEIEKFLKEQVGGELDSLKGAVAKLKGTKFEQKAHDLVQQAKGIVQQVQEEGVVASLQEGLDKVNGLLSGMTDAQLVEQVNGAIDSLLQQASAVANTETGGQLKEKLAALKQTVTEWWQNTGTTAATPGAPPPPDSTATTAAPVPTPVPETPAKPAEYTGPLCHSAYDASIDSDTQPLEEAERCIEYRCSYMRWFPEEMPGACLPGFKYSSLWYGVYKCNENGSSITYKEFSSAVENGALCLPGLTPNTIIYKKPNRRYDCGTKDSFTNIFDKICLKPGYRAKPSQAKTSLGAMTWCCSPTE